jgi:hypothetical protein
MENKYLVSVKGYHNGTYKLTVKQSPSNKDCKYVSGDPFGCSRDYLVKSDEDAIHRLMSEHSTQVVFIKRPENREAWTSDGRIGFYEE